jgi:hypothetical protein
MMHMGTILLNQRNDLVRRALQLEGTHILWLDSDMRFHRNLLVDLLEHNEAIVGCNYVTRRHPIRPVSVRRGPEGREDLYTTPEDKGLVEVEYTGSGVMLVDLDVYRNMQEPWYNFWFNEKAKAFVGEDVYFCLTARELGLKVLIDQAASQGIRHIGEQEYDHASSVNIRDDILEVAKQELVKA